MEFYTNVESNKLFALKLNIGFFNAILKNAMHGQFPNNICNW